MRRVGSDCARRSATSRRHGGVIGPDPDEATMLRVGKCPDARGESKRGQQDQSIVASVSSRAAVCRSPISPWSLMFGWSAIRRCLSAVPGVGPAQQSHRNCTHSPCRSSRLAAVSPRVSESALRSLATSPNQGEIRRAARRAGSSASVEVVPGTRKLRLPTFGPLSTCVGTFGPGGRRHPGASVRRRRDGRVAGL